MLDERIVDKVEVRLPFAPVVLNVIGECGAFNKWVISFVDGQI